MPLTYQNPWNFNDSGNSLGELLARVPQIRAQQAIMQQQMALEAQKVANEQQYQQGMLGYHQSSLAQQAPLITQQTAEAKAKTDESQKVMALADMFAKASRKMYSPNQEPITGFDYPSGQMIQTPNPMAQAGGDLTEGLSGLAALKPGMNPTETMLQLAARQQQGPFGVNQLDALLTGGHLNNPHAQPMLHGKPGDVFVNPSNPDNQITIPGQPYEPSSPMERWALERAAAIYKGASDLPPTLRQVTNGQTNNVPNPQWQTAMSLGDSMTNYLNRGQAPKANMPSQKVMTATNPKTGQKIQSLDGGKTWSPAQ